MAMIRWMDDEGRSPASSQNVLLRSGMISVLSLPILGDHLLYFYVSCNSFLSGSKPTANGGHQPRAAARQPG